jgi:hypothetical protein
MSYTTRDTYPKVGDYDTVADVSGAPSANTMAAPRPRTVGEDIVGGPTSIRDSMMVDAQTSEQLDARLGRDLSLAAMRRREIHETAASCGPGCPSSMAQHAYEAHVFGLNLGRG